MLLNVLSGNSLREACILLESVKNQFVVQSGLPLTKCGKTQQGESVKQVHGGIDLSEPAGGRERSRSTFCLQRGVASLKSLSVGTPRAKPFALL